MGEIAIAMNDSGKTFLLGTALGDALNYGFTRVPRIFKIAWPMLVGTIAIWAVQIVVTIALPATEAELRNHSAMFYRNLKSIIAFGIPYALLQIATFVVIARDYLLAEQHPWNWPAFDWTVLRTIGMVLLSILTGAVIGLPVVFAGEMIMIPLGVVSNGPRVLLLIGVAVAVFYILARVSTWVVSRAVGRPQTMGESWRATKGIGFQILAGMLVVVLLSLVIAIAVTAASAFLLYGLGQFPSPQQPVTAGYVVVALIQLALGVILSAITTVYITNVLKQTQA